MSISVVLRLAPAAVASRQLAGEVEVVATGKRAVITSAEDLLAFVAAASEGPAVAEVEDGGPRSTTWESRDA